MSHRATLGGRTTLDNRTEIGGRIELGPFGVNPLLNLISKYGVPALLFDNTEVYTDAAGTLPAGVGDVVGNTADLSGGSHDISQSVTASKPILRANRILEFDGTDDYLAGVNPFTGAEFTMIWCGKWRTAPAANETIFSFGDSISNANYGSFFATASGDLQGFITGSLKSGVVFSVIHPTSTPVTDLGVISSRGKIDVQEISQNQSRTVRTDVTTLSLENADTFSVGALLRTVPAGWAGVDQDYCFIINKYLTDAELAQAEQYISGVCGGPL